MSVPRDLRRSGGAKSPETRGVVWEVSSRKERAVSPRLPFQVVESSPERVVQAARRAVRPRRVDEFVTLQRLGATGLLAASPSTNTLPKVPLGPSFGRLLHPKLPGASALGGIRF